MMASQSSFSDRTIELGNLESKVLCIVRRLGAASAREVQRELRNERDLAYTTISTTLDRLHKKGLLSRQGLKGRGGSIYIYRLATNRNVQSKAVNWAVDRLLEAFGPAIVSQIYERLEEVPKDEIRALREKVERARRKDFGYG